MVRNVATTALWIIFGLIFVIFAVANRQLVTVSFNPFDSADAALAATMPLFVLIIVAVVFGVLAGSSATWLRQGRWRRAARHHEAEARAAQAQLANLQATAPGTSRTPLIGRSTP